MRRERPVQRCQSWHDPPVGDSLLGVLARNRSKYLEICTVPWPQLLPSGQMFLWLRTLAKTNTGNGKRRPLCPRDAGALPHFLRGLFDTCCPDTPVLAAYPSLAPLPSSHMPSSSRLLLVLLVVFLMNLMCNLPFLGLQMPECWIYLPWVFLLAAAETAPMHTRSLVLSKKEPCVHLSDVCYFGEGGESILDSVYFKSYKQNPRNTGEEGNGQNWPHQNQKNFVWFFYCVFTFSLYICWLSFFPPSLPSSLPPCLPHSLYACLLDFVLSCVLMALPCSLDGPWTHAVAQSGLEPTDVLLLKFSEDQGYILKPPYLPLLCINKDESIMCPLTRKVFSGFVICFAVLILSLLIR